MTPDPEVVERTKAFRNLLRWCGVEADLVVHEVAGGDETVVLEEGKLMI